MEQEKLWLYQYSSELEEKLKACEQKVSDEEFRCLLTDAIQKATYTENSILELKLHNTKLLNDSLTNEIQTLASELSIKSSTITELSLQLQNLSYSNLQDKENIQAENKLLKQSLETQEAKAKDLEGLIGTLQERVKKVVNNNNEIERKYYTAEYYLNELNKKDLKIEEINKELEEKNERVKELENITLVNNSEAQELFDQVCNLTNVQLDQVKKVINGEDLFCASNEKLKMFVEEYEKKLPIIQKQNRDYAELIISSEKTNALLASVQKELDTIKAEKESLEKDLESSEDLKRKNEYLSGQLTHILNSSPQNDQFLSFSSIRHLINEKADLGADFLQQENIIKELQIENERLRNRPVIIEEIIPSADYNKFIQLELVYQQGTQKILQLKKEVHNLTIANQELQEKVQFLSNSDSKLRKIIKDSQIEKEKISSELLLKSRVSIEFTNENTNSKALNDYFDSYLSGYRSEIERLLDENKTLFESLKANKAVLFECQETQKQRLNEILKEKSSIYSESQKLKIRTLELESQLKLQKESFEQVQKKNQDLQKVDTKEFAAINELHKCRLTLQETEQKYLEISTEAQSIRAENKILHEKILLISKKEQNQELKAKIEDLVQENYIVKCNCELLQERIKKILSHNLILEDQVNALQKELNEIVVNDKYEVKSYENDRVPEVVEQFEKRIAELVEENESKNGQILSLVSFLGNRDGLPEVMGKVVSLIHKITKNSVS